MSIVIEGNINNEKIFIELLVKYCHVVWRFLLELVSIEFDD